MKKLLITILIFTSLTSISFAEGNLNISILSSKTLSGVAGDYATVKGEITNSSSTQISNITTYLSLVDTGTKLPVDLEDWSAEKGLFIGTLEASTTLPLEWKIHFVKSGNYTLSIIANIEGQDKPVTSVLSYLNVQQKINLDPGHVLPVALGEPILLLLLFGFLSYYRTNKTKNG